MKCIKTLLLGDIERHEEYDESRDDEEYLEEIHEKSNQLSGSRNQSGFF
jgi:hypothetical protein